MSETRNIGGNILTGGGGEWNIDDFVFLLDEHEGLWQVYRVTGPPHVRFPYEIVPALWGHYDEDGPVLSSWAATRTLERGVQLLRALGWIPGRVPADHSRPTSPESKALCGPHLESNWNIQPRQE